jgi:hypothetical protein
LSPHFSKEFEAYALLLLREMPVARVAEITWESDTRLWRMIFKHVDGAYAMADFNEVCRVGVDEMGVGGGQEYISVFADLVAKRALFATEGRGSETWKAFVQALEAHHGDRRAITAVTMDMSAAYEKGVKENCRNAQVVFDKFHLLANASQRVDKVRRAEVRLDNEETRAALRQSQWLWRKNPQNLSPEEQARLARISDKNLCTAKAYQMRLVLQDIYRTPDVRVARRRFKIRSLEDIVLEGKDARGMAIAPNRLDDVATHGIQAFELEGLGGKRLVRAFVEGCWASERVLKTSF